MTNSPEQESLRAWAVKHFGVSATTTPQEIQAAFLQRIQRDNFLPPPATGYAFQVLAELPEPAASDLGQQQARAEVEAGVRMEVQGLAKRFFELSTNERQRIWKSLWRRASWDAPSRAFLTRLKPALFLVPDQLVGGEGPEAILSGMLCELFVLKTAERAVRRNEFVDELSASAGLWDSTAKSLVQRFPQLAALDPDFIARLTNQQERAQKVRRVSKQIASVQTKAAKASGGNNYLWVVGVAIFVALRLFASLANSNSGPRAVNPPNWQMNPQQIDDILRPRVVDPQKGQDNRQQLDELLNRFRKQKDGNNP